MTFSNIMPQRFVVGFALIKATKLFSFFYHVVNAIVFFKEETCVCPIKSNVYLFVYYFYFYLFFYFLPALSASLFVSMLLRMNPIHILDQK